MVTLGLASCESFWISSKLHILLSWGAWEYARMPVRKKSCEGDGLEGNGDFWTNTLLRRAIIADGWKCIRGAARRTWVAVRLEAIWCALKVTVCPVWWNCNALSRAWSAVAAHSEP
jgi:hypothetical protein